MVSSITPGAVGIGAFGVEPRAARTAGGAAALQAELGARGDRVEVGASAAWGAARESVALGLAQIETALSIGEDARALLSRIEELGRTHASDPAGAEAALAEALEGFASRVESAVSKGFGAVAGETIWVQADAEGAPLAIEGADLRLNEAAAGILKFTSDASFGEDASALLEAVQKSRDALQSALTRLNEAGKTLESHSRFVGAAADIAAGVKGDLDADGARLLALQVRQGLENIGGASIANVEPQAVLALFKT